MREYNLKTRDGRQRFYQSIEWRTLRDRKRIDNPLCELCFANGKIVPMFAVHHLIDIEDVPTMANALGYEGLQCICLSCHSEITLRKQRTKVVWKPFNLSEWSKKMGV